MPRRVIDNPNACSLVHTMNVLGNKWKPIIIYLLASGPLRFGKLYTLTPTISKKVLSHQLKELEADGILHRVAYKETPPRVEYSLTPIGEDVLPALRMLSDWAMKAYTDMNFEACRLDKIDMEKRAKVLVDQH